MSNHEQPGEHLLQELANLQQQVLALEVSDRQRAETAEVLRQIEEKLSALVDHSVYGYAELDLEGKVLAVNAKVCEIVGCPAEAIVGSHFSKFVGQDDLGRASESLQQAVAQALVGPREYALRAKNGAAKVVAVDSVVLHKREKPDRLLYFLLDVTEQRLAQQSARHSEADLRRLFENIPDFVIVVDREARIQFANRSVPGASKEDLLGSRGFDHIVPEHRPKCRQVLAETFAARATQSVEMLDVYGRWWACRLVPIPDEGGSAERVMIICEDITARTMMKASLQRSEARYRILFESTSDAVMLMDSDGFIGCNESALRLFGCTTCGELIGRHPVDLSPAKQPDGRDSREAAQDRIAQALATGSAHFEWLHRRIDRSEFMADVLLSAVESSGERLLQAVVRDITERRARERALQESERRYRLVAENVTDFVWAGRLPGLATGVEFAPENQTAIEADRLLDGWEFTFASPSIQGILGYGIEEGMKLRLAQLLAPLSYRMLRDVLAEELVAERAGAADPARQRIVELEHVCRDGSHKWCEVTMKFVRDENDRVLWIEGVTRDVTERKELEKQLSAISTQEQQRVGQQLHDGLGQQLLGLGLMAENLKKTLAVRGLHEAESIDELATTVRQAQDSVRALIKGVRPVEVDANGLMAALTELAASTEVLAGIPCSFECKKPVPVEDSHTATQLFHIASESVRNAVKHAKPSHIVIGLAEESSAVNLWVCDDGRGIGLPPDQPIGMGIRIMRYRAGVIGGVLTIGPAPEGGTIVDCILPLEH